MIILAIIHRLLKELDMYFANTQTLLIIALILIVATLALGLFWIYNNSGHSQDYISQFSSDLSNVREILNNNSYLHRLLMIEIIGDKTSVNKQFLRFASQKNYTPNSHKLSQKNNAKREKNFNNNYQNGVDIIRSSSNKFNENELENSHEIDNMNFDIRNQSTIVKNSPHKKQEILELSNSKENYNIEPYFSKVQHNNRSPSEEITFNKMASGMSILGKSLIRSFGITIAQKIATLMHKRNEILREYYWSLRDAICYGGASDNCFIITEKSEIINDNLESNEFKDENGNQPKNIIKTSNTVDIITTTQRKLEAISREITDNIAASFHIRDIDQTANKNRPIVHYQRLFNLMTMYDKELVNQAKSYASHNYDISMNCSQSSIEITYHISDELSILMKESQQKIQTLTHK